MNWDSNNGDDVSTVENFYPNRTKLGHELRSVLHALLGYLDIFRSEASYNLDQDQHEILSKVSYFANRLIDLVDQLLVVTQSQLHGNES